MNVTELKEHEDGSATYQFDMTDAEHELMCKQGIIWCLVAGITGVTPEQVLKDYLDEQAKEDVLETAEGTDQEESD